MEGIAISDDAELAAWLAHHAGRAAVAIREQGDLEGIALGEAGDERVNRFLTEALNAQRPDDAILSEEAKDDAVRLDRSRVWIIDPIDGTREYGEGRDDWAVHIALCIDGVAAIGAVALPARDITYRSDRPIALPKPAARPRMVVSRSRQAKEALTVAAALDARLIAMGSAGAKAMAVVRGDADIYLHSGGQYEWDSAAPVAVAMAHGLHCSRIDGAPLRYNRRDTYVPDLLICRPEWADRVLNLVRS